MPALAAMLRILSILGPGTVWSTRSLPRATTAAALHLLAAAPAAPPAAPAVRPVARIIILFPATAPGRAAAQRGKDEGYLRVVRTDSRGKAPLDVCAVTDKGLAYLLSQASPRLVLEDFIRALDARHEQAGELLAVARQMQAGLDALRISAGQVLAQLRQALVVGHLARCAIAGGEGEALQVGRRRPVRAVRLDEMDEEEGVRSVGAQPGNRTRHRRHPVAFVVLVELRSADVVVVDVESLRASASPR